jgi:hypothetical protein
MQNVAPSDDTIEGMVDEPQPDPSQLLFALGEEP